MRRHFPIPSLSRRFVTLTVAFVMLAEVLIFIPSVAFFRLDYLQDKLGLAQIAAMVVTSSDDISEDLAQSLRDRTGADMIVVQRDNMRQLVISRPIEKMVQQSIDLRQAKLFDLIVAALARMANPSDDYIRVLGPAVEAEDVFLEIVIPAAPLRAALLEYSFRIFLLSAFISSLTSLLLLLVIQRQIVRPIKHVVGKMQSYAHAPQDARNFIDPSSATKEVREAEEALQSMQAHLTTVLRQNQRLVQLGTAVAKISHDLRNILTSVQLFADRLHESDDPLVRRLGPKLVGSVKRAVNLTETTLAFGRAEEPPPRLSRFALIELVDDLFESEALGPQGEDVNFINAVPRSLTLRADQEQLYRILGNLLRNARQAMQVKKSGNASVAIDASETDNDWLIRVRDNGPGVPQKAQEHLFEAFAGTTRAGGTGLGLAIAAELVRGHGGELSLEKTGVNGTWFLITLPKTTLQSIAGHSVGGGAFVEQQQSVSKNNPSRAGS